jgi:membrane-bound metal-dependent hydrolase YbcI (DUF457 family)
VGLAALSIPLLDVSAAPSLYLGAVVASGVPDLDFLGVLLGYKLDRVHRQGTHSLIVLALLAGLALWVSTWPGVPLDTPTVWVWAVALLAHPLTDALVTRIESGRANLGLPLFWPLSSRRYCLPRPLIQPVSLESYTSLSGLRALLSEIALFGSTCLTLVLLGRML